MINFDVTKEIKSLITIAKNDRNRNKLIYVLKKNNDTFLCATDGAVLFMYLIDPIEEGAYKFVCDKKQLVLQRTTEDSITFLQEFLNRAETNKPTKIYTDVHFNKTSISSFIHEFPVAIDYKYLEYLSDRVWKITFCEKTKPILFESSYLTVYLMGMLAFDLEFYLEQEQK